MNALLQLYPGDRAAVLAGYVLAEITVLVAMAWVVAWRLGRGRPAARYGVWLCALACVVLSPLATLLLDRGGLVVWTVPVLRDAAEQRAAIAPASDAASGESATVPLRQVVQPAPWEHERTLADAALLPPLGSSLNARPAPLSWADRLRAAGGAGVAVWLAGIAFLFIRLVRGWCVVARLKREVEAIAERHVLEVLEFVRCRLGLSRLPRVVTSRRVGGPVVVGVLRPMVILPEEALPTLGPEQMRDILVHECAHVARRDHWVSLLQRLVEMLFWPHLLVHYLNRQLSRAREEVCDNYVLGSGDAPGYARTLLTLSERATFARPTPAGIGLLQPRWRLEDRVAGLLDTRRDLMLRMSRWTLAAVLVTFLTVTVLVAGTRLTYSTKDTADTTASAGGALTAEGQHAQGEPGIEEQSGSVVALSAPSGTDSRPSRARSARATVLPDADDHTVTARGLVLDPENKPLVEAHVAAIAMRVRTARGGDLNARGEVLAQGTTDDNGRYELTLNAVTSSTHEDARLIARKDGFGIGWHKLNLDATTNDSLLTLTPDEPIRGRLIDIEGQPAGGVRLLIQAVMPRTRDGRPTQGVGIRSESVPAAWLPPVTSDEHGRFTIRGVPAGHGVFLDVEEDDRFAPQGIALNTGLPEERGERDATYRALVKNALPGEEIMLALSPAQIFEGVVTYEDTGKPAPHARLTIMASQQEYGSWVSLAGKADAAGRYRMRPNPGILFAVTAYPPDGVAYLARRSKGIRWNAGDQVRRVDVSLPRGVLVRGRVRQAGSGAPVAGASIQYIPEFATNPQASDDIVTRWQNIQLSGEDGRFEIAVLPGPGRLFADGPNGQYVLQEIAERQVWQGVPGGLRYYAHAIHKIEPARDAETIDVDLELTRGATIAGRVVNEQREPIEEFLVITRVKISPTSLFWRPNTTPTLGGRFEITGVEKGRQYPVYFLDPKRRLGATAMLKTDEEEPTVVLHPCGKASMRFVDRAGTPVPDHYPFVRMVVTAGPSRYDDLAVKSGALVADADFIANIDRTNYLTTLKTDAQGTLTLPALIPGATYRVFVGREQRIEIAREFRARANETLELGDIVVETAPAP